MKYKNIPFDVPYDEETLNYWFTNDRESYDQYFKERFEEYYRIQEGLREGEPHEMAFENYADFEKAKETWKEDRTEEATARAFSKALYARDQAIRQRPPVDRDLFALSSRNPRDKKTGGEILRDREFITDQLNKAVEYRSLGDETRAKEAEARAAMMTREIKKLRKDSPYSFQIEADKKLIDGAISELESAMELDPSIIEENRTYFEGLVTTFNNTFDGEFSFAIDSKSNFDPHRSGESKIIKIEHGGLQSRVISQMAEGKGMSHLDSLLVQGYGITNPMAKEEEEAPAEGEKEFSREKWEESLQKVG